MNHGRPVKHVLKDFSEDNRLAWCVECMCRVIVRKSHLVDGTVTLRCNGVEGRQRNDAAVKRQRAKAKRDREHGQGHTVDPGAALAHVEWLRSLGLNYNDIADLAHGELNSSTIAMLRFRETIQRSTEVIILDLYPQWTTIGLQRRVHALMADGFPQWWQAEQVGCSQGQIAHISNGKDKRTVFAPKIVALYDRFAGCDPVKAGIPEGVAQRTRSGCRRHPPTICWDSETIDDPKQIPQWTGECGTRKGVALHEKYGITVVERSKSGRLIAYKNCAACRAAAAADVARLKRLRADAA